LFTPPCASLTDKIPCAITEFEEPRRQYAHLDLPEVRRAGPSAMKGAIVWRRQGLGLGLGLVGGPGSAGAPTRETAMTLSAGLLPGEHLE